MPCISVIVPTYNVLPYLDRSMTSLLGQTHRDLDILLIDDGATDGCAARCDAYARQDPRVRVVHQPGVAASVQPATPGWTMQSAILSPSLTRMTTPTPTCWNGF